mgnify:CR=1 FL=1
MIAAPFEKTYLSRAQSRIWSMDNPVGDPFGGPAYGLKEEPVSMIAAIVAIGVGASTVAAATTLTLAAVMGGLMIAGGAASLIGTVSGNKKLAMIGGIVAGVGGLGLGAANMFADAAASSVVAADAANASSAATTEATLLETGGQMANGTEAVVPTATESVATTVPSATEATVNSYQAPANSYDPTATSRVVDGPSNGLINNAIDTNAAGQVADIAPQVANPVDAMTDQLTTEFSNVAGNTLQSSPYESLADASGNTQLVPNGTQDLMNGSFGNTGSAQVSEMGGLGNEYTTQVPVGEEFIANAPNGNPSTAKQIIDSSRPLGATGSANIQAPAADGQTGWLDKIEGIAKGIEKYKTTANIGGNLISGAMKYAVPSQSDQAAIELYQAKANLANQEASAIAALEDRKRRQNEAVKNLKPIQLNNASNPIFGNALNGAGIINSARA